jgi:glyoxylase-like metal-dependent hydrolase (beta-lactamase superfamily II)
VSAGEAPMSRRSIHSAVPCLALAGVLALAGCSKPAEAPPPTADATAAAVTDSPGVHSFKIGEFAALALRDGSLEFPNDNKVLGVGLTPADVAAVLSAAGQPTDKLQLGLQPLLVKTPDRVLLFDTGAGSNFGPSAGQLPASLANAGVDPASVTDIFISHIHGDHVGGLVKAEGVLNFPNATIHISRPEWEFLRGLSVEHAKSMGLSDLADFIGTVQPKIETFEPGAVLVPDIVTAVPIKGHTPGHSGYKITSGAESLLYIGDAMHHFVVSVQRPQWINAFDGDGATAAMSRAALLTDAVAAHQRIYAVHFPFPGLGHFVQQGEGYVWVAE